MGVGIEKEGRDERAGIMIRRERVRRGGKERGHSDALTSALPNSSATQISQMAWAFKTRGRG